MPGNREVPLALCALALTACAGDAFHMVRLAGPRGAPDPVWHPGVEQALAAGQSAVVFVRPSRIGFAVTYHLVDGEGRFLGDLRAMHRFAVAVPPGPRSFVVYGGTTDALTASLLPAHVYYVAVSPGLLRISLRPLDPRGPDGAQLTDWIRATRADAPDEEAGQRDLLRHPSRLHAWLERGADRLARFSPDELAAHTLRPEFGTPWSGAAE